jgi:hypothetical protein
VRGYDKRYDARPHGRGSSILPDSARQTSGATVRKAFASMTMPTPCDIFPLPAM